MDIKNGTINLNKFLALAGVAPRRACAVIIKSGAVSVNGETVEAPGHRVSNGDKVFVEGHGEALVQQGGEYLYYMLNKPPGYVCTNSDPHAQHTVFELLPTGRRLFCVGRLDKDSEGLLLVTDDGDFGQRLAHPRHGVEKVYQVSTTPPLDAADLRTMRSGIADKGEVLRAVSAKRLGANIFQVVLRQGRNREIRRMVVSLGKKIDRLRRVAIGGLEIGTLRPGRWRRLSQTEINLCAKSGKAPTCSNTPLSSARATVRPRRCRTGNPCS